MATTATGLTNATVTAKQAKTGYDMSLYVIAVEGAAEVGISAANRRFTADSGLRGTAAHQILPSWQYLMGT
jgi:hypothetical protein